MSYRLGIDIGTTRVVAARERAGQSEVVNLGDGSTAMAANLFHRSDGSFLAGEAAAEAALSAPGQGVHDFLRRLGDPIPLMVGGKPISAEDLVCELLQQVRIAVVEREGTGPDHTTITHPATWDTAMVASLVAAAERAGFCPVDTISTLEAAARQYATTRPVAPGEVLAVYRLGGATFETAVFRRTRDGFFLLGRAETFDQFGGVDLDQAVYSFVTTALDPESELGALASLDVNDPLTAAELSRLRRQCIAAKERLSSADDTGIDVSVGPYQRSVRITRADFEAMIRPSLGATIDALRRAVDSAGIATGGVASIVAVGGSASIPLVSDLLESAFGRPVRISAHPDQDLALGAAVVPGPADVETDRPAASAAPPSAPPADQVAVSTEDPFVGLDFRLPLLDSRELVFTEAGSGGADIVDLVAERAPVGPTADDDAAESPDPVFDSPVSVVFDTPTDPPPSRWSEGGGVATLQADPQLVADSPAQPLPATTVEWDELPPEPAEAQLPPAAPYVSPPGPSRVQRPLVVATVATAMLVAVIGAVWASSRTEPPKPSPTVHAFAPASLPSGLLLTRTWRLSGPEGNRLQGEVLLTNQTDGLVSDNYDEVIPKSVAASVGDIRFSRPPDEVVREDPVVRYFIRELDRLESSRITYEVDIEAQGNTQERLDALAADQVREEAEFKGTATPTLASLLVTPEAIILRPGQVFGLTTTGQMADGSAAPLEILDAVAWSSDNVNVVTVEKGTLTGIAPGAALVTAQVGELRREVRVSVAADSTVATRAPTTRRVPPTRTATTLREDRQPPPTMTEPPPPTMTEPPPPTTTEPPPTTTTSTTKPKPTTTTTTTEPTTTTTEPESTTTTTTTEPEPTTTTKKK